MRTGRFDEAIARLAPLLKENPNFVQARLLTGQAQLSKRDVPGAIAQFEAASRINPQLAEPHYYLARALVARGDVEGAKKEYQRAVELAPAAKQIALELSALSSGKSDPALLASWIEDLKTGLAKNPTDVALREELGKAYLAKDQFAESEAEFKRVLEVSPLSPAANRGMGLI